MRVISQSGVFDAPYEQIIVQRNENIVQAISISTGVIIKTLGKYETPKKAEKAMEMLRKQYMKMETQNVTALSLNEGLKRLEEAGCSMDEYNEVFKSMMSMFVFRFPQNSNVNVEEIMDSLSEEELCKYCKYGIRHDCDGGVRSDGSGNPIYPPCADGLDEDDFDLDTYLADMEEEDE